MNKKMHLLKNNTIKIKMKHKGKIILGSEEAVQVIFIGIRNRGIVVICE